MIRDFVSTERETPIVLSDHSQTGEPGLYDGVGDPANLVPPERAPGGRGGMSVPGGRRSKQRSRRAERPQPAPAAVPAAAKRSRRSLLVGALVLVLIAAGISAAALAGGGGDPARAGNPSTSAIASPVPVNTSVPPNTTAPGPTTAPDPTTAPSPTPTETETAPAAPTSLSGVYSVVVTVEDLGSAIEGVNIGDTSEGKWLMSTDCAARPCSLQLIGATFFGAKIDATGPFQGRTFNGDAQSPLECSDTASGAHIFDFVQTGGEFTVHVTDVRRVAGVPQATAIKGSFDFTWVPPRGGRRPGCEKTSEPTRSPAPSGRHRPPSRCRPGRRHRRWPTQRLSGRGTRPSTSSRPTTWRQGQGRPYLSRVLSFIPKCKAATGCPLTLIRERSDGIGQDKLIPGPDGAYIETLNGSFDCGDGTADYDADDRAEDRRRAARRGGVAGHRPAWDLRIPVDTVARHEGVPASARAGSHHRDGPDLTSGSDAAWSATWPCSG